MFSIIIVYNNLEIMNSLTVSSLSKQSESYQLILIENIDNKNYKSAASALNAGAIKAENEYLMFVHQDVDFQDVNFLKKSEVLIRNIENLGIAGVAGISSAYNNHLDQRRNRIIHGMDRRPWGNLIDKAEKVQTLDECLLIIPKKIFLNHKFDEYTCDDWHLYGVDYCLSMARFGLDSYVIPLSIYHQSSGDSASVRKNIFHGSVSPQYFRSFERVRKKHKQYIRKIYTTCASFDTYCPVNMQRVWRAIKRHIFGLQIESN